MILWSFIKMKKLPPLTLVSDALLNQEIFSGVGIWELWDSRVIKRRPDDRAANAARRSADVRVLKERIAIKRVR